MATKLDIYLAKRDAMAALVKENKLQVSDLAVFQELIYRIGVLQTFLTFTRTAPTTKDPQALAFHFQLVFEFARQLSNERKFGPKTDENGTKTRETARISFEKVIMEGTKSFSSFKAASDDHYQKTVSQYISNILTVWIQYRNTYINIKED